MRDVVRRLATLSMNGPPISYYSLPRDRCHTCYQRSIYLALTIGESLFERSVFHMFPGLAWNGKIDGKGSEEFFISDVLQLLQQRRSNSTVPRILCVDTTKTENAVNKAMRAMRGVCDRFSGQAEVRVIGIVNGAESALLRGNLISIEYGVNMGTTRSRMCYNPATASYQTA